MILRGGKAHSLFMRVAEASTAPAIVVPADAAAGVQVQLRSGDLSWQTFLARGDAAAKPFQAHVAGPNEACCILFSSGTTGGC